MTTTRRLPALAFLALLALPAAAAAGPGGPVLAVGYWEGFVEYWKGVFQQQNGVVMGVLGVGAVALFIITRGKWRK